MSARYVETKVGYTVIPAGDASEHFIANLILTVLLLHSGDIDVGQSHLSYAHSIAASLEKQAQTYRSGGLVKVVGITSSTDTTTETLMVPIVGEHLVIPKLDLQQIATRLKSHQGSQLIVSLKGIELSYHQPRLRPARLRRALAAIIEISETDRQLKETEGLLTACLGGKRTNLEAVDLAYDYLSLTYDLSSIRNFMLADLTLKQATHVINEFIAFNKELSDMQSVIAFKAKAEILAKELRAGES